MCTPCSGATSSRTGRAVRVAFEHALDSNMITIEWMVAYVMEKHHHVWYLRMHVWIRFWPEDPRGKDRNCSSAPSKPPDTSLL